MDIHFNPISFVVDEISWWVTEVEQVADALTPVRLPYLIVSRRIWV